MPNSHRHRPLAGDSGTTFTAPEFVNFRLFQTENSEMAITLARLGEFSKAEHYAREALRIRTNMLGENHIDTIKAMNNLGHILLQQDGSATLAAREEASRLLDRAFANCQRHHADRLEELIDLLSNRASLAFASGDREEAEQLTRTMLGHAIEYAGNQGTKAITARQNLAMLLNKRGEWAEAEAELGQVADDLAKLHGDRHPATLKARMARALTLTSLQRYAAAETIYRQHLPVRRRCAGRATRRCDPSHE